MHKTFTYLWNSPPVCAKVFLVHAGLPGIVLGVSGAGFGAGLRTNPSNLNRLTPA